MSLSKRIILAILPAILLLFMPASAIAQQAYGTGDYGACNYSEGCAPVPTTVVPIPPSPTNPQEGRALSVNLTDNQVIPGPRFTVISTPNFSVEQIDRVELLQDSSVIGQAEIAIDGRYEIEWVTPPPGTYKVSVVVYLVDGSTIRRDFTVAVDQEKAQEGLPLSVGPNNGSATKPSAGFFAPINQLIQKVPKNIAYAMPYVFLGILGLLIGLLLIQVRNQFHHIGVLLALLKRDEQLADEKTTFIMLVSHYFRTPLTVILGNLELYASVPTLAADPNAVASAQTAVNQLKQQSEALLKDIENNSYLQNINKPDLVVARQKLYYSWSLMVPVVLSVILFVLMNVVFIVAGKTQVIIPNLVIQLVLAIAMGVGAFTLIQRKQQYQQEQSRISQQSLYQEQLDIARNTFIRNVSEQIAPILAVAKQKSQQSIPIAKRRAVDESFDNLDSLVSRFTLAAELEKGKIETSLNTFALNQAVSEILATQQASMTQKGLAVANVIKPIKVHQSSVLVRHVLDALIDNAVTYAAPNTRLDMASQRTSRKKTHVAIRNQGLGIPADKLERLFKPFSHIGGVETFNDQGIGLNLYLSRLIARYLGGDLELHSKVNENTTAIVTLPLEGAR